MDSKSLKSIPLVSIVIPAYNAESFIQQTLSSVVRQTYQNLEVIVVDDGSKDNTVKLVREFTQSDPRVSLISQSNFGVSAARNLGIEKSTGEFIAFIDADDIYFPDAIAKLTNAMMQADNSFGVVYGWTAYLDERGNLTGNFHSSKLSGDVYQKLLESDFIASATLVRKSCIEQIGNFNCQMLYGCEDWDFYLKLSEHYHFKAVPECIYGYRQISESNSGDCLKMEQGYKQFMKNASQRNPDISTEFKRACLSNFLLYLSSKSRVSRRYFNSIRYVFDALKLNSKLKSSSYFYRILMMTLLETMFSPFSFIIWNNNQSWMKLRQLLKFKYYRMFGFPEIYNISNKLLDK